MRKYIVVAVLSGCLMLLASEAKAQKKLVYAFSELEPWKIINNGQCEGAYAELGREIALRMGMEIEFIVCPLKRCLIMLENGDADLVIGLQDTPERRKYLQFLTTPYRLSTKKVFYLRKGAGHRLQRYEDLYQLKIGAKRGAALFEPFDNDPTLQKEEVSDHEQNVKKLLVNRIDTFGIPEDQGVYLLSKLGVREAVEKAPYFYLDNTPRYPAISKRSQHIQQLDQFERVMKAIVESGMLEKIMVERYFIKFNIPMDAHTWK